MKPKTVSHAVTSYFIPLKLSEVPDLAEWSVGNAVTRKVYQCRAYLKL